MCLVFRPWLLIRTVPFEQIHKLLLLCSEVEDLLLHSRGWVMVGEVEPLEHIGLLIEYLLLKLVDVLLLDLLKQLQNILPFHVLLLVEYLPNPLYKLLLVLLKYNFFLSCRLWCSLLLLLLFVIWLQIGSSSRCCISTFELDAEAFLCSAVIFLRVKVFTRRCLNLLGLAIVLELAFKMVLGFEESLVKVLGVHLIKACLCEALDVLYIVSTVQG